MTDPLTDAEKLTAIDSYIKTLTTMAKELRTKVTDEMGMRRTERVGAYLPDGTKIGAVTHSAGNKTAKVIDQEAALKWCTDRYPDEIVRAINPAFLKGLLDAAKATGSPGEPGYDPRTGEVLDFIEVVRGAPYVVVTTTDDGVDRMRALAFGFAGMLEAPAAELTYEGPYDPAFADRLESGAYKR